MKAAPVSRSLDLYPASRLPSNVKELDEVFHGGLAFGSITEWGVPLGRGGRDLVLAYVAAATRTAEGRRPHLVVWIFPEGSLSLYPPAWEARGVALSRIHFARTSQALRDLKPVFLDSLFSIVVLDAIHDLDEPALAFLAAAARRNGQMILLLRNELLGNRKGNVWAKQRVNAWRENFRPRRYVLQPVRGLSPSSRSVELAES